jgi:hypothetical protein
VGPALFIAAAIASSAAFLPPNDPDFKHCIGASQGVRLEWRPPDNGALTYLLVKRLDDHGQWRPWLRTERAKPPFTLTMHSPLGRQGRFGWLLFSVKGHQRTEGAWHFFCTAPSGMAPPSAAPGT